MVIEGKDLTGLENESGGLRIQRVPPTEKRGRVHTSTVTVAVLDHAISTQPVLDDRDLRIEWFHGTGPGGQHRNKHANSCRLIHLPTGTVTTCQSRSRESSLASAREEMARRLREETMTRQHLEINYHRRSQLGSGQRGDKTRTIQFTNDRVVDHRTGGSMRASDFMSGFMHRLWPSGTTR